MSLVIDLYHCPTEAIIPIGQFTQCNALLNWFDHHLIELQSGAIIEFTRELLEQLLADLNQLSANNCEQLFPTIPSFVHGASDYNEAYWQQVVQLRGWIKQQLADFNFASHRLFLQARW